ncbi:serine protease [Desmonostoc muscorum LEGE 12446]|uniref:Trypsin-like peptidase domain-containing protein n=1 Tax=Desmonostoc muscorum LEGE 12446 TaxID=1828758 RepID=A0A8J7DGX2_DESMC|nr:serine protease [Desmonostoc muscorum]MCF2148911.1 serine protease [Desmonostoc muscorum LEGE 12446]
MDWRKLTLVISIGSLSIILSASTPVISVSPQCQSFGCNTFVSQKLYQQAQSITVKILAADFLGSGILLQKQGLNYTVLTNAHVLEAGDRPYRIQTPDGNIYAANLPENLNFGKNDLALLQFHSQGAIYAVASLGNSPVVGDEVFAAGFPVAEDGTQVKSLALNTGKISLVLPNPLEGGYQLGHTNNLENGMSGGALLNRRGEVVGVNGMQAYPLWDAPSVFQDGMKADEQLHKMIIRLSWAVPIKTYMISSLSFVNTNDY